MTKASELEFLPGAAKALFRASRAGWKVYLLGNEDAVLEGRMARSAWDELEVGMLDLLSGQGIVVARSYACVAHPEGSGAQRGDSVYFLPNTGAFYHAAHVDGVELAKSWVIGDSTLELVAGWRAGCRLAAVRTGEALADRAFHVEPELWARDLAEVLDTLLELQAVPHA